MNDRTRLRRILRLKERLRDASAGRLAAARAELSRCEAHVRDKDAELRALAARYARAGQLEARELEGLASLHARGREERAHLEARRAEAEAAEAERRGEVAAAGRELRRFEVLDGRLATREREADRRAEQDQLDESARRIAG